MKKSQAISAERQKPLSVCEACGAEFACGAGLKSCWCFQVKLSVENREELKSEFTDCLCRNCLEKKAEGGN